MGGSDRLENGDVVTIDTKFEVVGEWTPDETADGEHVVELFKDGVYLRVLKENIRSLHMDSDSDHDGHAMGQILRQLLDEHGPLTFDELNDKVDEEVQAGIRYLRYVGELDEDQRLVEYNTREYSIRDTSGESG